MRLTKAQAFYLEVSVPTTNTALEISLPVLKVLIPPEDFLLNLYNLCVLWW